MSISPIEHLEAFAESRAFTRVDFLPTKLLSKFATLPKYGSDRAAGLDLSADLSLHAHEECRYRLTPWGLDEAARVKSRRIVLEPGERRLIHTGIAIAVPKGHYARVAPRSGLALKAGVDVMAGVVDEDYRGEIGVVMVNLGKLPVEVNHGDRIAQLVIEKITPCLVWEYDELPDTDRGSGGYGSTGK